MQTQAVIFEKPKQLSVSEISLVEPSELDVVVETDWSGISTGTERLLWTGRMPSFPGLGYPLVPGYESVGKVVEVGSKSSLKAGETVFVPGASCYGDVKGLFGGASSTLVVNNERVIKINAGLKQQGVLLALAATAYHALSVDTSAQIPDLIVGHGVLGRLLARIIIALGYEAPTVWETDPTRMKGATGYSVLHPDYDDKNQYQSICDVSGNSSLLDSLIARLSRGGEIVLAGFYDQLTFSFPPAFMREMRMRVTAEWKPKDLIEINKLIDNGKLSLDGLITHSHKPDEAAVAYQTAFEDSSCLKMILEWRPH
jgi:3-hydroxyethyl bacteriochlorophyllide a dehydrogenase